MKIVGYIVVAAAVLAGALQQAGAGAKEVVITTADGNGADTYVRDSGSANLNFGDETYVDAKTQSSYSRLGYFRFDLSSVDKRSVTNAVLQLDVLAYVIGGGGSGSGTVEIYGLTNQTLDSWIENDPGGITWNTAPARDGLGFDADEVILLGSFTLSTFDTFPRDASISNVALVDFLKADTNGLAALLLYDARGNAQIRVASKENTDGNDSPTLQLTLHVPDGTVVIFR